jgi:hypothetical protein
LAHTFKEELGLVKKEVFEWIIKHTDYFYLMAILNENKPEKGIDPIDPKTY